MKSIYLIGSLKNSKIPLIANQLRERGPFEVFDDWYSGGYEQDDKTQEYAKIRGLTYQQALQGYSMQHTFKFDFEHINRCDIGVLVLPAGKSGHLELGYMIGSGKPGYILLDGEPDRYDVMYNFATYVCQDFYELLNKLEEVKTDQHQIQPGTIMDGDKYDAITDYSKDYGSIIPPSK